MATLKEIQEAEVEELPVRTRVEAFFKGTDAIRLFAEEVMIPVLQGQLRLNDHERAVTGTYYRMYLYVQSLVKLNSRIHFQAAASAARTTFELLLDLKLLAEDTADSMPMTEKFHAFTEMDRFRVATQVVEYKNANPGSKIEDVHQRSLATKQGKQEAIDLLARKNWGNTKAGKPQKPKHWSGFNVKERAVRFGSKYEELYIESYPLLSWSVHAGPGSYAGLDENEIELCFGLSHSISQRCFLEATAITAEIMRINHAVEGFNDILESLRLVPGRVIVKEQARIIDEERIKNSSKENKP
ncbi:MAG: hypothetical protein A4E65_00815 [Syntrophorhabdus sp. PtaU1.Bin153]|nr:MAG: hypothetical protein A4E65_00815 [Syntrophorhabdus sp. PtaU1.Bin153]